MREKLTGPTITDEQCATYSSRLGRAVLDLALSAPEPTDEVGRESRLGARTLCAAVANDCSGALRDEHQPRQDMEHREGGFFLTDPLVFFIASGGELRTGRDVYLRALAREVLWLRARSVR
jgi:hypothetical protein